MSAYGNLTGTVPMIWGASLAVVALSGLGVGLGTWIEHRQGVSFEKLSETDLDVGRESVGV